ncbi:hypothetical protein LshimejAT787_0201550 [Lyophyllum shimeji]|uniref:Transmembrane protein n=1 Tax=Lyophyllum shimeji TaxID=47721 RepID=A0A9P3PEQ6_LYOSH|nr:hypothetical protein LshimejAT787_0201550 [Lyophyllum shimeji]
MVDKAGPQNGHLGTTWEITLVTIFVALVFLILGTVLCQVRRKQRRRRQEALDAELGRSEIANRGEKGDRNGVSLSMPEPAANPARHSKSSRSTTSTSTTSYHEHDRPSNKPPAPRYYWDYR